MSTIANIGIILLVVFGVYKCNSSDWWQEGERNRAARERAREVPHVIREADGCKVYAFREGGHDHYFTRCGDTVTTDRTYTENCGKGCTRTKTETIATKGNK